MKNFKHLFYTFIIVIALFFISACTTKQYDITFNLGYDNLTYLKQKVDKGNIIEKPDDPQREGFNFLYWQLDNEEFIFNKKAEKNLSLTAEWEKIFQVDFYLGYGNSYLPKQLIGEGNKVEKPDDPQREGYLFLGWFIDGVKYDFDKKINEDILLVGKWVEEKVDNFLTVTFNSNDDNLKTFEQTVLEGEKVIRPVEPVKTGYKFLGWYLDDVKYEFNIPLNKNIVLNAKWEKLEIDETFFIVFNSQGGNYTPEMLNVEKGAVIEKPDNPTLDGHLFIGWYYGEQLFDFKQEILKDYLLVAKWLNINDHKIFINDFKTLENNSEAIITGVITSFSSFNYLTIEDESGAIAVLVKNYNMNELKYLNLKKGDRIILQGTKDIISGLIVAKTNIDYLERTDKVSPLPSSVDITNINFNELDNFQSKLVVHNNLIITNIKENNDKLIFTMSNGEQTIEAIYETRYIFVGNEYLYTFSFGDIVRINKALLTMDNDVYIALGEIDEIIKIGEIGDPEDETLFKIFYLNDTHGAILNDGNELGLARIGNYIKKTKDENSIFLTGGDILQGQLISNTNKGALMMEVFNNLELDAFVIGNHEFDWGLDVVLQYFDPNTTGIKANFPILGANVKQKNNGQRPEFIDSHTIIQRGNYKIGIIGVIGDGQESSIMRLRVKDYYFSDAYTAVQETVNEIKNKVDFILVVSHDGNSTFNQKVSQLPKVFGIFNGHSHVQYSGHLNKIPYIQSGANAEAVGQVDLKFDKSYGLRLINSDAKNINRHPYLNAEDDEIKSIIDSYYNEISHLYTEIIIHASSFLSRDDLAYFSAKLMAKVTNSVFGFQNRGGTRAAISQGPITGSDVFKVFPFDNQIISAEIMGRDLKSLINNNEYSYLDIELSTIENNQYYRVATNDYLFYSEYNERYFASVYDESVIYGDLYETFYNYLVNLKTLDYEYFETNHYIPFGISTMNVFSYYDRSEVQIYN